jgi:hypothetical protein
MKQGARAGGRLRRLIDVATSAPNQVTAWVEDDFHHFGLTLTHQDGAVVDIAGTAARSPWSTCPGAVPALRQLIGKPLVSRTSDVGTLIDMRQHCTHLFDLAGLALSHAANGRLPARYEAIVPDPEPAGDATRHGIVLSLNGQIVMQWSLRHGVIVAPAQHAGQALDRGFRAWTETLPAEEADHAFILRRAVMVAGGRMFDLDRFARAEETGMPSVCHTYQPGVAALGLRNHGTTRDFAAGQHGMLALVGTPIGGKPDA